MCRQTSSGAHAHLTATVKLLPVYHKQRHHEAVKVSQPTVEPRGFEGFTIRQQLVDVWAHKSVSAAVVALTRGPQQCTTQQLPNSR